MDVGTGGSGEGIFPPVPHQAQAGPGAARPTVCPLTEVSWPKMGMINQLQNSGRALSLLEWGLQHSQPRNCFSQSAGNVTLGLIYSLMLG